MRQIFNIIWLRFKVLFRTKSIVILTCITTLVLVLLMSTLYVHMDQSTKINIALVDNSNSDLSNTFIKKLESHELFNVVIVSEKEGIKKVRKSNVQLMVVLPEDINEKIRKQEFEELIHVHYMQGDLLSPLLGDVILGEILDEIAVRTAVSYIEEVTESPDQQVLNKAYSYGRELIKEQKDNYYIKINYVNLDNHNKIQSDQMNTSLIYQQMIMGITLTFLAFYILFASIQGVKDQEKNYVYKIELSKTSRVALILGDYLSIFLISSGVGIISAFISAYFHQNFLRTFFMNSIVFIVFVSSYSAIVLAISKCFRKVSSYVVVGTSLIVILGIISGNFFTIDLTIEAILQIASLIPSYHALNQIMYIIVTNSFMQPESYMRYSLLFIIVCLMMAYFIHTIQSYRYR